MKRIYLILGALGISICISLSACSTEKANADIDTDTSALTDTDTSVKTDTNDALIDNETENTEDEDITDIVNDEDTSHENSVFTELDTEGASDDFIAIIIDQPDDSILEKIPHLDTYSYDKSGESILVIPRYENSRIELNMLSADENGELTETGVLYAKEDIADGYALLLYATYSEEPTLSVSVTQNGMTSKYILKREASEAVTNTEYMEGSFDLDNVDSGVKFNYREVSHIFNLDYDTIIEKFGEPDEINNIAYMYLSAVELKYGENTFKVEQSSGYIYEAEICDNTIKAPRDLGIASTGAYVLSSFPNESDGTRYHMNDESGSEYETLYSGTDDSAIAVYNGDELTMLKYKSKAVVLAFEFEDDIVTKIIYKMEF